MGIPSCLPKKSSFFPPTMPTLATRTSAQLIQVPHFDAQPELTSPNSTPGATNPNETNMGIHIVGAVILLLLFAKIVACWRSWRLWNNLTTLLSYEQDILRRSTPNAAPGTSTEDQGGLGDKDRLIPLDKSVNR